MDLGHIHIIGLGLMGASLARALKRDNPAQYISGCSSAETVKRALSLGIIDEGSTEPVAADIIVICTPLSTYPALLQKLAPIVTAKTIITDVGSVKGWVAEQMAAYTPHAICVPGHPIAGTEKSGLDAGFAELYDGKRVILTQDNNTIATMWQQCGAKTEVMDPTQHDRIYAEVSHVVQKVISTTAPFITENLPRFLRIASSPQALWKDIFAYNATELNHAFTRFVSQFESLIKSTPEERTARIDAARAKRLTLDNNAEIPCTSSTALLVACALVEIASDSSYAGSGFRDATSPLLSASYPVLENDTAGLMLLSRMTAMATELNG